MSMTNREHWHATKHLENPIARWWNVHYITATELKQIQVKQ